MPWVGLQCLNLEFPDHTHFLEFPDHTHSLEFPDHTHFLEKKMFTMSCYLPNIKALCLVVLDRHTFLSILEYLPLVQQTGTRRGPYKIQ